MPATEKINRDQILLTVGQVAARLAISKGMVWKLNRLGKLKPVRLGGRACGRAGAGGHLDQEQHGRYKETAKRRQDATAGFVYHGGVEFRPMHGAYIMLPANA